MVQQKGKKVKLFDFNQTLKLIVEGKKMSRQKWQNTGYYGFLKNNQVHLHKVDGYDYQWIIGIDDIMGKDFFILN